MPVSSTAAVDPATLAACIRDSEAFTSAECFRYREVVCTRRGEKKPKVDHPMIQSHATLFRGFRKHSSTLSFSQSTMQAAMGIFVAKPPEAWKKKPSEGKEQQEWASKMAKRVRSACRDVAQALGKKAQSPWIVQLFLDVAVGGMPPAKKPKPSEVTWLADWDEEKGCAVRRDGSSKKARVQYSKDLFVADADEGIPDGCMSARWPDGFTVRLVKLPVQVYRTMPKIEKTSSAEKWAGGVGDSKVTIHFRPQAKRNDLYIMYKVDDATKQICQIDVMAFGTAQDTLNKFIGLGERFCAGDVDIDQLYKARDQLLKEVECKPAKRPRICKKPACHAKLAGHVAKVGPVEAASSVVAANSLVEPAGDMGSKVARPLEISSFLQFELPDDML